MLTRGDLTFEVVRVRAPKGETLETYEVVMFWDLFTYNLWLPSVHFLWEVLDRFRVQLHHLTPNNILNLAKFY